MPAGNPELKNRAMELMHGLQRPLVNSYAARIKAAIVLGTPLSDLKAEIEYVCRAVVGLNALEDFAQDVIVRAYPMVQFAEKAEPIMAQLQTDLTRESELLQSARDLSEQRRVKLEKAECELLIARSTGVSHLARMMDVYRAHHDVKAALRVEPVDGE